MARRRMNVVTKNNVAMTANRQTTPAMTFVPVMTLDRMAGACAAT